MKDEQCRRAAEIFLEATDLEEEARRVHLDHVCRDEPELRAYVEQLLAADTAANDAFDEGRLRVGHDLLADVLGLPTSERQSAEGTPSSRRPLPTTIGRYRILEKIGEGGMGAVFLAEQDHPHRRVALKMIRPGMFSTGLRKRFRREAEVLGRLQHPGIAQIHEAGEVETEAGPQPYFAMEYVEGTELRQYVRNHRPPVRARLELIARIADAVHHAHQKGIVHRDLKPENVLVKAAATTSVAGVDAEFATLGQPKILDFGVARATDADIQLTTMQTELGQLVGTLPYMSPEQVAGDSSRIDTRSDIYALGVLLYELLAGRPPFDLSRKPIAEAARVIREVEPTRLGSIDTALRGDIDTIACKALAKDRDRRYASAADLASDIRRYLANEPITAHPPSTFYQLRKFAQRHRGLVAGLALTMLVLIVGIISSMTLAIRALRGEELAKANERRALTGEAAAERNAQRLNLAAAQAVGEQDTLRALAHLEAVPPESRGWEWRHLLARFDSHVAEYHGSSFSGWSPTVARGPDGGLLAVLQRAGKIELVNLATGEIRRTFASEEPLRAPGLAPEGSHMSAFSADGRTIYLWKIGARGSPKAIPVAGGKIFGTYFSSDGRRLAVCFGAKPVLLVDTDSGCVESLTDTTCAHQPWGAFTTDGSHLVTQTKTSRLGLYSLAERKHIVFKSLVDSVRSCALSPDEQRIAVGQFQRMIRILDVRTLEEIDVFRGHTQSVTEVAYSVDGRYLASASHDGTVRVWDVVTGKVLRALPWVPRTGIPTSLVFSADGKLLAAGSSRAARLWRWRDDVRPVLEASDNYVYHLAFHSHQPLLASGPYAGEVRLWDSLTGEALAVLQGGIGRYYLGFTADGTRLVMNEGERGKTLTPSIWSPFAACRVVEPRTAQDREFLESAATGLDPDIRYFRTAAGGAKAMMQCGECLASSTNRAFMVRPAKDLSRLELWDLQSGRFIREIGQHATSILAAAFSPDGTRILSGDTEGTLKVWDVAGGTKPVVLRAHSTEIFTIAYHPDGTRFATSGNDAAIILWDADTLEQVLVLRGHTSYVHSLCFSPDGTQLVSGSGDGTVRIWDSVPPAKRWKQIRKAKALRREAAPLVDRLLRELNTPLDVADRLRGDRTLDEALCAAALQVLLQRASVTPLGPR